MRNFVYMYMYFRVQAGLQQVLAAIHAADTGSVAGLLEHVDITAAKEAQQQQGNKRKRKHARAKNSTQKQDQQQEAKSKQQRKAMRCLQQMYDHVKAWTAVRAEVHSWFISIQ